MNLSGQWRFNLQDSAVFNQSKYQDASWKTMPIPCNWFLAGLDHHGVVWFRRSFRHADKEGFFTLRFEGVDYFAEVYLNDCRLGSHAGYFEPFEFDVTNILRSGQNLLAVRVDSPYETPAMDGWHLRKRLIKGVLNHHDCRPGGGWDPAGQSFNTGGIWNQVYLVQHGPQTIERLLLTADLDSTPPALRIEIAIRNRSKSCKAGLELSLTRKTSRARLNRPVLNWICLKANLFIPCSCQ